MSDLYLELVSRIPIVAEQTVLGTQRIKDAQARVGLSNEAIARSVHVSEKTWRRWKNQGSIPTASLPAAALALRLDIQEFEGALKANGRQDPMTLIPRLIELLETVIERLPPPQAPPGEASEPRA